MYSLCPLDAKSRHNSATLRCSTGVLPMSVFISVLLLAVGSASASASADGEQVDHSHVSLRAGMERTFDNQMAVTQTTVDLHLVDDYIGERIHTGFLIGAGVQNTQLITPYGMGVHALPMVRGGLSAWYDIRGLWIGGEAAMTFTMPSMLAYNSFTGSAGVRVWTGNCVIQATAGAGVARQALTEHKAVQPRGGFNTSLSVGTRF